MGHTATDVLESGSVCATRRHVTVGVDPIHATSDTSALFVRVCMAPGGMSAVIRFSIRDSAHPPPLQSLSLQARALRSPSLP